MGMVKNNLSDIFRGKVSKGMIKDKEEVQIADNQPKVDMLSAKISMIRGNHPLLEAEKMSRSSNNYSNPMMNKSLNTKANMLMGMGNTKVGMPKMDKGNMLMGMKSTGMAKMPQMTTIRGYNIQNVPQSVVGKINSTLEQKKGFLRVKNISLKNGNQNPYLYLCQNTRNGNKVKQKVLQYIGKVENLGQIKKQDIDAKLNQSGHKCQKCGMPLNLTTDHIIPLTKMGTNEPKNLQILCKNCNTSKGVNIKSYDNKISQMIGMGINKANINPADQVDKASMLIGKRTNSHFLNKPMNSVLGKLMRNTDGDKARMDMLDCNVRNPLKQGPEQAMIEKNTGMAADVLPTDGGEDISKKEFYEQESMGALNNFNMAGLESQKGMVEASGQSAAEYQGSQAYNNQLGEMVFGKDSGIEVVPIEPTEEANYEKMRNEVALQQTEKLREILGQPSGQTIPLELGEVPETTITQGQTFKDKFLSGASKVWEAGQRKVNIPTSKIGEVIGTAGRTAGDVIVRGVKNINVKPQQKQQQHINSIETQALLDIIESPNTSKKDKMKAIYRLQSVQKTQSRGKVGVGRQIARDISSVRMGIGDQGIKGINRMTQVVSTQGGMDMMSRVPSMTQQGAGRLVPLPGQTTGTDAISRAERLVSKPYNQQMTQAILAPSGLSKIDFYPKKMPIQQQPVQAPSMPVQSQPQTQMAQMEGAVQAPPSASVQNNRIRSPVTGRLVTYSRGKYRPRQPSQPQQ